MKTGEIIEVEGVRYIAQEEILACKGCYFEYPDDVNCYKEFGCRSEDKVIFVKIPLELLRKIEQLEEEIEILQHNYNCKKSDNEIMCKRLQLLTDYLKLQGHTDAQINEIIKLRGE